MRRKLFFLSTLFFLVFSISAGEIEKTVSFSKVDLHFSEEKGYDVVKLKGCMYTHEVGAPLLPCKGISVLIPPGAEVVLVEAIDYNREEIPGEYNIYPTQPPQPISYKVESKFVPPDPKIYQSNSEYPGKLVEIANTGAIGGYRIANILVYPIRYIPGEKRLVLYTNIRFKIVYKEGISIYAPRVKKVLTEERVSRLVINPEDIDIFAPIETNGGFSPLLSPDTIDYVTITSSEFDTVFQRLVNWKTKKGVPSKVVILDSIYADYTGVDNPERIRNFIKDANLTWGTIYFLLAGQCDFENGQEVVPRRDVYYILKDGNQNDTIPSDLYYSDLDGDWNADGDNVWGESTDSVDLYSDVFVGRAPCYTLLQAQTFVNKVLTYEKNPDVNYQKKLFLPAGILWSDYQGDTIIQNLIADMTPGDWQKAKLYERLGNLTREAAVCSMNVGFALGHFVGHGNKYGIYYGPGAYLNSTDADTLSNMPKIGIYNSIGCMLGALDYVSGGDCFAERLVNNPDGGVLASIMNTRYGWGMPPNMGPSEFIDACFFHEIFREDNYKLGMVHAYAKDGAIPYVTWSSVWAWCIYELNLWGDPELPIWTDMPDTFEVVHDDSVPIGATSFSINVTSGGAPVENAYVCLYKPSEVYSREYTDVGGNAVISMTAPTSIGTLYVTVTKHNYIPKESYALVISPSGPYLVYQSYLIDDDMLDASWGDNDSLVDAGETIELPIFIKNVGVDTAKGVQGILHTADTFVVIIDSTDYFGDVLPDSVVSCTSAFVFQVDINCPNNHNILFTLVMQDTFDSFWTNHFIVPVPAPTLKFVSYTLDDDNIGQSNGNSDGYAGPGETIELSIKLKNRGAIDADSVVAKLYTYDTYINITDSIKEFGDIPKDSMRSSLSSYVFEVDSACPKDHIVTFYLDIWDSVAVTKDWVDSFDIKIWYPAQFMLVAKDPSCKDYFTSTLDSLGYTYDVYEWMALPEWADKFNLPDSIGEVTVMADTSIMKLYPIIIWSTGYSFPPLNSSEQDALAWWLDRGGKLFITGQDIGWALVADNQGPAFYHDYLHADYISDDTKIDTLTGILDDPISDGIGLKISGGDGANNQDYPSEIDTLNGSSHVFQYVGDGYGAVKYEGAYRVVYFAFGFEAINNFATRKQVLSNILLWFGVPVVRYVNVVPQYVEPESSVTIYTRVADDDSITQCFVEIESPNETVIDTVYLYDDGMHNDSLANDLVFANTWVTEATPKDYWVDLHVCDTEGYWVDMDNATWFSTKPPPVINLEPTIPDRFVMKSIYPNPAHKILNIEYGVSDDQQVRIIIYDLAGRKVGVVTDKLHRAGHYKIKLQLNLASGIYFAKVELNGEKFIRKFVVVK